MDGTGLVPYTAAAFGINGVEPLGSAAVAPMLCRRNYIFISHGLKIRQIYYSSFENQRKALK